MLFLPKKILAWLLLSVGIFVAAGDILKNLVSPAKKSGRNVFFSSVRHFLKRWKKFQASVHRRYFRKRLTLAQFHFATTSLLAVGFVLGSYFTISEILLPRVRALTETTTSMPTDIAFNRAVSGELAAYDDDNGMISALSAEVKLAITEDWWDESFEYKREFSLRNLSAADLATPSAATAQITINTQDLVSGGKLQSNCNDLRVVYTPEASDSAKVHQEIPRAIQLASGAITCGDSSATIVSFPMQETLQAASASAQARYAVYYGNEGAGEASYPRERYLSFDGVDDRISESDTSVKIQSGEDITIEALINMKQLPQQTSQSGVVSLSNSTLQEQVSLIVDSNRNVRLCVNTSTCRTTSGGLIQLGKWHHVAVTYSSTGEYKIFVDGVLSSSGSAGSGLTQDIRRFRVGIRGGEYFTGFLDQVRISNAIRYVENFNVMGVATETDEQTRILYKFDEDSGTTAIDASGNNNNGTITGATRVKDGLLAYSVGANLEKRATLVCPFNGTTDCMGAGGSTVEPTMESGAVRFSGGSALAFERGKYVSGPGTGLQIHQNLTVEGWINPTRSVSGANPGLITVGSSNGYLVEVRDNKLQVWIRTTNNNWSTHLSSNANITLNTWTHIAVTYTSGSLRLYINGVLDKEIDNVTGNIAYGVNPSYSVGTWGATGSNFFPGLIDEVRISNTVRYTSNFTPQTAPFQTDEYTKLLLHFDENGDDPRNLGKAIDASGNGNHGTIAGAKYVSGLVGIDKSVGVAGQSSVLSNQSFASHEGIFIEEGTTNKITNPSFEHSTYNTNWGTSYYNQDTASSTFTPGVAKRNSAGPFAQGVMVGGGEGSGIVYDSVAFSRGSQISSLWYQNFDPYQGSIVFWVTPEWNGNDGKTYYLWGNAGDVNELHKNASGQLVLTFGWSRSVSVDVSNWVAGNTYNVVARWDRRNTFNGTNFASITIDNQPTFGITNFDINTHNNANHYVGARYNGTNPANAIIEGLTIYRRPLFDGTYGIDVGNGNEIAQIYNNGTGRDPTLVTGSWDVVFALSTDSQSGSLSSGTGNAWTHPHSSNLLYTSTTNTGGFMMNGNIADDGWREIFVANPVMDTEVRNATPDSNFSTQTTFRVSDGSAAAFMKFDVSAIPNNATILEAKLNFVRSNTAAAGRTRHIYSLHSNVTDWIDNEVTWNNYKSSTPWPGSGGGWTSGTDYESTSLGSWVSPAEIGDIVTVNLTTARVQSWVSDNTNYGITLRRSAQGSGFADEYYSTNHSNPDLRPTIEITYTVPSNSSFVQPLATSEKIFVGGYKFTSTAANQGIKRTLSSQPIGRDYVVRALAHSDGTSIPKIQIWDTINDHEITQLTGTATATRENPDVLLFTFELPYLSRYGGQPGYEWVEADSTEFEVRLLNTESSGTTYWHQVEVYANQFDNPSVEVGSGDPWIPSGMSNYSSSTGELSQELTEFTSGYSALRLNVSTNNRGIRFGTNSGALQNNFYSVGANVKKSSGGLYFYQDPGSWSLNSGVSANGNPGITSVDWKMYSRVQRALQNNVSISLLGSGAGSGYLDDVYRLHLTPVSLTVTPASQANSTESTGLRVSGASTLTQPITGLSTTSGTAKFRFTPRHSFNIANKFGANNPTIIHLHESTNNQIRLLRQDASTIRLAGTFNGTTINADWSNPTLNAGTTYAVEIGYTAGGNLTLKIDGVEVATTTGVVAFSTTPTTAYFGTDNGGANSNPYDATFTNFVSLTPTGNTTSAYNRFGNKSLRLVNAGSLSDEYVTTINPASTASHTLTAFVYDNTSGNIGGTVNNTIARLVFNGSAVTPSSYTDMGGGWWRLSYTAATVNASTTYGVQVLAGKTVYVDGVQLEQKAYATTYTDGSLGTGYSWSGTANESSGVRAAGTLNYSTTNTISTSEGTVSLWYRPNSNYPTGQNLGVKQLGLFTLSGGSGSFRTYFTTNGTGTWRYQTQYSNGGNNWSSDGGNNSLIRNEWDHIVVTWDVSGVTTYRNDIAGTLRAVPVDYTGPTTMQLGFNPSAEYANGALSDFRVYDSALTATEISQLYNQGLITHTTSDEANDRYNETGTYTSPTIDLAANGAWGTVPAQFTHVLNTGGINYLTRTSRDNSDWTDWQAVSNTTGNNYDIASPAYRYLQWQAQLTASEDQSQTPVVSDLTLNYVGDASAPQNPTVTALGYSNSSIAEPDLVSGTWYNHPTPKLTWEEATDIPDEGQSSSGIHGYHVLLTTDVAAVPTDHIGDNCYKFAQANDRNFIPGASPSTCQLTDANYYLRLQAKDNAGNTASPVTLFTYKYDSTPPRSPATVSSATVGYTSENNFTFFWPTASDTGANQSGVSYYEYKTGAEEGVFSDWQRTNDPGQPLVTQVENVEAYQEGQNFFFVRSVDFAGNLSAETSNLGVSPFYYNASAPTAPTNVVISPNTSSAVPAAANIFEVTWDRPSEYSGEIAKYYYCVNCEPSAATMTQTSSSQTVDRTLTNMPLATRQGKNTLYIVAEDNNINTQTGNGNRNWEAYAAIDFYASTVAPGAPQTMTIADASNRDDETWRLTLAWKAPAEGGAPSHYAVYRSTDSETFVEIGQTTSTAYTDADLDQSKEYSYKVKAVDDAGSESIFSNTVSLAPEGKYSTPPAPGGVPTAVVGSSTATITWQTSRLAFGTVEYGKTTSYGSAGTGTAAATAHTIKLTGLSPGETYHFRVQSLDDSGLVGYSRTDAYSADYTFTTLAAPEISDVEVVDRGLDNVTIQWNSTSLSSASIEYGLSQEYGSILPVSVGSDASTHTARITGLEDTTLYHFRIRAVDLDEIDVVSDDYTFETLTFPRITAVLFNTDQSGQGTSVSLAWSTNVPTTGEVEYQAVEVDPTYRQSSELNLENTSVLQSMSQTELAQLPVLPANQAQSLYSGTLERRRLQRIAGLTDGSMYVFTIRGRDEFGNEAVSEPIRYVTGADTRPPEIQNLIIETPISGVGSESKAQIVISFETDEPASTQVLWGQGVGSDYPQATEKRDEFTTQHVVVLRDLNPNSSYHFKLVATDQSNNTSESEDTVVVTPTSQEAAFDIILKNLEGVFGFLRW